MGAWTGGEREISGRAGRDADAADDGDAASVAAERDRREIQSSASHVSVGDRCLRAAAGRLEKKSSQNVPVLTQLGETTRWWCESRSARHCSCAVVQWLRPLRHVNVTGVLLSSSFSASR